MEKENVIGNRFGRLVVISDLPKNKSYRQVLCLCDCGIKKEIILGLLKSGQTKSCGCLSRERSTTHGMTGTPLYWVWAGMIARCNNTNHFGYNYYGTKGINVCKEWRMFLTFYNWSNENGYRKGLTIERINNTNGYNPDNCKWVTRKQNTRNRRNTILLTYNGEVKSLAEWCEILNLSYQKIYDRLYTLKWKTTKALQS
jgi:hypothetical protein